MAEEQQRWWYIFISSDRNFSFGKKALANNKKTSKSDLHYNQLSCFHNNHKNERITTKTNNLKSFFVRSSRTFGGREQAITYLFDCVVLLTEPGRTHVRRRWTYGMVILLLRGTKTITPYSHQLTLCVSYLW